MLRVPLLVATLGLALNVMLWTVPILVAGAALPGALFPDTVPTLSAALHTAEHNALPTPGVPDALLQLVGAEAEALHVAGQAIQQPDRPDLAAHADAAGAHVESAVATYIRAVAAALDRH